MELLRSGSGCRGTSEETAEVGAQLSLTQQVGLETSRLGQNYAEQAGRTARSGGRGSSGLGRDRALLVRVTRAEQVRCEARSGCGSGRGDVSRWPG